MHGQVMSEPRKRRTRSDAEVSAAFSIGCSASEPPKATTRRRRASNARQAKLIAFPMKLGAGISPQVSLSSQNFVHLPHPLPPRPQYSQPILQPTPPAPKFTSNSIHFCLPPTMGTLCYMFSITLRPWQKVILNVPLGSAALRFSINNVVFERLNAPVDVTAALLEGDNRIMFYMNGGTSTTFVEMNIESNENIDALTRNIVENRKYVGKNELYGNATENCPLTGKKIVWAGRGSCCTHAQAFDIRSYIEKSIVSGIFECPVCKAQVPYDQLIFDEGYMKRITSSDKDPSLPVRDSGADGSIFDEVSLSQFEGNDQLFTDRDF